ncbi:short chain dehydrogenase [Thalassotalea euphylliae]|uniref:Short chain dehydrogenase n=1 Tax=Thalassotalea euphylliae TaxID=1655234 RepID=A0A3E0UBR8_9GAMM|nr:short chain dehydrogenase [Thalassotalea euphylliae]REL34329.1 short chain dehydrogenase [Thalassotalea euphylliae]
MKKIVVIGATGTIGKAVVEALDGQHQVISVANSSGDWQVDLSNEQSISTLFDNIGAFDELIVTAGDVAFADFNEMTSEQWQFSLANKLMGQINLARYATKHLNQGGSITLTSGILTDEFVAWGTAASTVNGAIDHFVKAASTELPKSIRINAVSPTLVTESIPVFGDYFPGFTAVPAAKLANAYLKSAMGVQTGTIYKVFQ